MIPLFKVFMASSVDKAVSEVLHSGSITQGKKVEEFERLIGDYLHSTKVLTVNSGTSALTLSLRLAGIGRGSVVASTPMTCSATNAAIAATGARIIWVDVDATGNMDPIDLSCVLMNHKVDAIMCVNWGGLRVSDEIFQLAAGACIPVIEDSAHGFYPYAGPRADYTCYSFQAIKHLTTGDGGAILFKDTQSYERGKKLRWFGIDREEPRADFRLEADIEEWGYKFHMNDLNATIGIEQIRYTAEIIELQRFVASMYDLFLDDFFDLPMEGAADERYAPWLYTIILPNATLRNDFRLHMEHVGIQVSEVHKRNDKLTCFARLSVADRYLPGLELFASRQISIPSHWAISPTDREEIITQCNAFAVLNKAYA